MITDTNSSSALWESREYESDIGLHKQIPTDFRKNLQWRAETQTRAVKDIGFRKAMLEACALDINFWVKGFGWTYDPRKTQGGHQPRLPFIPWGFQVESFLEMDEVIGREDLLIEKSRDMGASWMLVAFFAWRFLHRPMQSFLLGSRKESYVDRSGDPKALFWKIDFLLNNTPPWMRPKVERFKLHIKNKVNGSTIDGESTTKDFARGDRRTAIGLDEFATVENGQEILAATADATNSRIFNSTPKGTGNAFFTQREQGTRRLTLHWSRHPEKAKGLYRKENGSLTRFDDYEFPDDYDFKDDGKYRSPWYDMECARRSHQIEIAQELDIDYLGSEYQFFDPATMQERMKKYAMPPLNTAFLEVDPETCRVAHWAQGEHGQFRTWLESVDSDIPKPWENHTYALGVDIASGTGASNSVISIIDRERGTKVAEYVNSRILPERLAKVAIALSRHFNNAILCWEANGPGRVFGSVVMEIGYGNIYLRVEDEKITHKVTDVPGWVSTKDGKQVLLSDFRDAIVAEKVIIPSVESYQEALQYIHQKNGSIDHTKTNNSVDPSSANDNHGDRVIADALAFKMTKAKLRVADSIQPRVAPPGSMAHRRLQRKASEYEKGITW